MQHFSNVCACQLSKTLGELFWSSIELKQKKSQSQAGAILRFNWMSSKSECKINKSLSKKKQIFQTKMNYQDFMWCVFLYSPKTYISHMIYRSHTLYMSQNSLLIYWLLKYPVFWFIPFSKHRQSGHTWYLAPHYTEFVWLTGCHAAALVIKYFPYNPYLGKQRISIGAASNLSIVWFYFFLDTFCCKQVHYQTV